MAHLSPDTFIDLVDGTLSETAVPHLAQCAVCRQQLAGLRAMWRIARETDVPEPSPLFWDHLSDRVKDLVRAEPAPASKWQPGWNWRFAGLVGAAAAVVVVVIALRLPPQQAGSIDAGKSVSTPQAAVLQGSHAETEPLAEDPSLVFVADLASSIEWDRLEEFGQPAHGDADRVVAEMNDEERLELRRLLDEALATRTNSL